MEVIEVADETRSASFLVQAWSFVGASLSATYEDEAALIEEMLGSPIDPQLLGGAAAAAAAARRRWCCRGARRTSRCSGG